MNGLHDGDGVIGTVWTRKVQDSLYQTDCKTMSEQKLQFDRSFDVSSRDNVSVATRACIFSVLSGYNRSERVVDAR